MRSRSPSPIAVRCGIIGGQVYLYPINMGRGGGGACMRDPTFRIRICRITAFSLTRFGGRSEAFFFSLIRAGLRIYQVLRTQVCASLIRRRGYDEYRKNSEGGRFGGKQEGFTKVEFTIPYDG